MNKFKISEPIQQDYIGKFWLSTVELFYPKHFFETCLFWDRGSDVIMRFGSATEAKDYHNDFLQKAIFVPTSKLRREQRKWRRMIKNGQVVILTKSGMYR